MEGDGERKRRAKAIQNGDKWKHIEERDRQTEMNGVKGHDLLSCEEQGNQGQEGKTETGDRHLQHLWVATGLSSPRDQIHALL